MAFLCDGDKVIFILGSQSNLHNPLPLNFEVQKYDKGKKYASKYSITHRL
jgi:hypothetical protein